MLERQPEEREAFLCQECAGDKALEGEVRSLLALEPKAGSFLQTPVMEESKATAQTSSTLAGTTISHYRVIEKLGDGGMGTVWKARDTRLNRYVALKLLHAVTLNDPERKRRFTQEARSASALNHPNIVTIHDIDQADGADFIAMEFVPGKPLDQLIPRKGLRLKEAIDYAVQIADALVAAHGAGIVHRDLKPGNIMVSESGCVKVLDFGLAKLMEKSGSENAASVTSESFGTDEGMILGTASYMSPEQAEGKKVDARSDIFSFGAVLYEMITGRRAFPGDSMVSIMSAVLRDAPKPAAEIVKGLPRDLDKIVTRCLRKDSTRRFQSMADLKVALEDLKEEFDSGVLSPVAAPRQRRLSARGWVAGAALLAAAVIAAWLMSSRAKIAQAPLTAVPLATYPGSQLYPTFSPDGSQVAFSWDGDKQNNFDIYVKLIGAGPPLRLTTDSADDFKPAWSPDGRSIAFLRQLPGGRVAVMLISPLGGPERRVAEIPSGPPSEYSGSPSWSPDSKYLAVSDQSSADEPLGLFLLSIETGEKRRLTYPPRTILGDRSPAFSPDGRMLAFTRSIGLILNDIYVVPVSATLSPEGESRRLTFDNHAADGPAWMPDGRQVIFSSNRAGLRRLWRIPVKGGEPPQRLESIGEDGAYPAVSSHGHRLVYTRSWVNDNTWRIDLASLRQRNVPGTLDSSVLTASSRNDEGARFSPDSKKIVFGSSRAGFREIWLSDSNGLNPVQMTSFGAHCGSPAWSPDGRLIAFDSIDSGQGEVYVVGANGGRPTRLTHGPPASVVPRWSGDGKWIYFRSLRSGANQIWKMPSGGGDPVQVTRKGGFVAMESPDGNFLYYTKTDNESGLWKMPVGGGEEARVLEGVTARAFAVLKDGIYFFATGPAQKTLLQFHKFATNQTTTLGTIEKPVGIYLDISADGRWLLYSQEDQRVENLMLVENFH